MRYDMEKKQSGKGDIIFTVLLVLFALAWIAYFIVPYL